MDERQKIALLEPCARAEETLNPKFWQRLCIAGRWFSSIITVNK